MMNQLLTYNYNQIIHTIVKIVFVYSKHNYYFYYFLILRKKKQKTQRFNINNNIYQNNLP